jgi:hypothetical protein
MPPARLRHYGSVTSQELLQDAAAQLYAAAPHEFVSRRAALAAQARTAGDARAAKQIAALRKPTQSAWVVNQLARADPAAATQLTELGAELRQAQRTLDGTAIRELSVRRRELVDDLARRAFAAVGQQAPPAALREEVTTTLAAALADPEIASQLAAGTMARVARSDGFASAAPLLTVVPAEPPSPPRASPPPPPRRSAASSAGAPSPRPSSPSPRPTAKPPPPPRSSRTSSAPWRPWRRSWPTPARTSPRPGSRPAAPATPAASSTRPSTASTPSPRP